MIPFQSSREGGSHTSCISLEPKDKASRFCGALAGTRVKTKKVYRSASLISAQRLLLYSDIPSSGVLILKISVYGPMPTVNAVTIHS